MHAFLAHLEDAFLVRTLWMEDGSERQRLVNPRKAYPGSGKPEWPETLAMNFVGNYFKPGLDTLASQRRIAFTINDAATVEWFMAGNFSANSPASPRPCLPPLP